MIRDRLAVLMTACALTMAFAGGAVAQGVTVQTRPRPELAPLGVRAGSFFIYPNLRVVEEYDDNIDVQRRDKTDDFITRLQPSVSVESNWNNHALNFDSGADVALHAENGKENWQDWDVGTDGRLDVTRATKIFGGASYARRHQDRADPDAVSASVAERPTMIDVINAFTVFSHDPGRLNFTLAPRFVRRDYNNVQSTKFRSSSGAKRRTTINEDDRDRNVYRTAFRTGYEITPDYELFGRIEGNKVDYDTRPNDQGLDRNSWGYEGLVGLSLDLSGVTFGDIGVGYLEQFMQDNDLNDVSGPVVQAALDWNLTPITTIGLRTNRTVEQTTASGASAILSTSAGISIDHELLRNMILNANFTYTNDDFEGSSRDDDIYATGAGVRYLMNRHFSASFRYRFTSRNASDAPGRDYTRNRFLVAIEGQL